MYVRSLSKSLLSRQTVRIRARMSARKRRLLCFDGGGVRGLSSLYLLKQLMESIDYDNPPKPCEWFDMIGGTSTGG